MIVWQLFCEKTFIPYIPFSFNALNATFAGIPSIKLPPSGKKVSLATRVSARYGGIISFICYSLYDTYLLRIKRTDSIVQKGKSGIGMDTVIFQDSAPYLYKCDRQQCRLVPDIFLARQCCPSYQAFQQTWYCAPMMVMIDEW